jgi:hypothetical protein
MRMMAIRVVRSYKTVSFLRAGALAGVPPLELLAQQYSRIFREVRRLQREGCPPDPRKTLRLRREARAEMLERWRQRLEVRAIWSPTPSSPAFKNG